MADIFQHTPGPWLVRTYAFGRMEINAEDGQDIASIRYENYNNAHLIAAAPCMLDALHEARIALATDCDEAHWIASNVVETAIAKAEGHHHA